MPVYDLLASIPRQIALADLLAPRASAQGISVSNLNTLDDDILSQYLKSIPSDPRGAGVAAANNGNCIDAGSSYGYASDGSGWFSITARSESQKGNTDTCGNTIDRDGDGNYRKE